MPRYVMNYVIGEGAEQRSEANFEGDEEARSGARKHLELAIGVSLLPGSLSLGKITDQSDDVEWLGAWDFSGSGAGDYDWEEAE